MVRKVKPAERWDGHGDDNNFVQEGSQDIDINEIYKILGLGDGSELTKQNDPIFKISRALNLYTHDAYPVHIPAFARRLALIKDLSEKASALSTAFSEVGVESFYDIEWGIEYGLDLKHSAVEPTKGDIGPEIALFRNYSAGDVHRFAEYMKAAANAFPSHEDAPPPGRPAKTALVALIRELSDIYEKYTEQDAYEGFTFDQETQEYDSSFFRFAWAIIPNFDPSAAKTNNALGAQIRKALADYSWQPVNFQHHYDSDFDFTDGKE